MQGKAEDGEIDFEGTRVLVAANELGAFPVDEAIGYINGIGLARGCSCIHSVARGSLFAAGCLSAAGK